MNKTYVVNFDVSVTVESDAGEKAAVSKVRLALQRLNEALPHDGIIEMYPTALLFSGPASIDG